jgi:hypothetical protein
VAHRALFDSDSFDILVDGGATASISNCFDDFIQPPTTVVFVVHKKKFQVTIPLSPSSNVGILCSAPGHQVFLCFVEDAKPRKEPPPAIFAYTVITDDEADDMELQEETGSVSTADDADNVILRGGLCGPSAVRFDRY